jgi:hypothetical protein
MINLKLNPGSKLHKFSFVLLLLITCCVLNHSASAHAIPQKMAVVDDTHLKAFEGIYQSKDIEFSYFQITVVADQLHVKQIDGDRQFNLTRKSDLVFETKDDDGDETIQVVFSKNDAGDISQATVAGKQIYVKVKNYVPVAEVKLTADELKAFEGKYQFEEKKDTYLQITSTPDGLTLKQLWDGREINFISIGNLTFLNKLAGFPLKFTKDTNGNVVKLLAFNRDLWDKVKE